MFDFIHHLREWRVAGLEKGADHDGRNFDRRLSGRANLTSNTNRSGEAIHLADRFCDGCDFLGATGGLRGRLNCVV